jgi:hypothetical protein
MFVRNQVMYHFNNSEKRKDIWVEGKTIDTFNYVSDMWNNAINFNTKTKLNSDGYFSFPAIIDVFLEKEHSNETYTQMLKEASRLLKCYSLLERELILEEVRKKYYKKLPSRITSIFLCDSKQIEYWKEKLTNNSEPDLFEVKVTGKIFKSNDELLPKSGESYLTMVEQAKKYWNADLKNIDEKTSEYLLEGKIKILEKCKI